MGDVVQLPSPDLSPDNVLSAAKGRLDDVMVIGFRPDGSVYFASNTGDIGKILVLLERAKAMALASVISVPD